ncbi:MULTISPECIES: M1 family metallopeptidase [unclassified Dyella]|uniref:M1 family metallopeptidase n=1 Tax=unclassified Dyella TaxID=2634549 RepID=UPI000C81955C|nr:MULTISPECIES: M1 family metallopeptidase [unclassified Dyella]MDR3447034.1 M1 family metallopeptidase [Dyella sp.]PMQ06731.1 Aminopeptidase N [Dyella sp. AD56]
MSTPRLLSFALCAALATLAHAEDAKPAPEQPPLTEQTQRSGGQLPVEQQRVNFDHAELHFSVDPAQQSLDAEARLTFTAREPADVLLLDLDPHFTISELSVDGKALSQGQWSNPEGRLRITLPKPLAKGGKAVVEIHYGGKPHVAKKAPWDGGFVWSHTDDGQPWIATAVEGEGCDLFWPCIDHPQGKPDLVDTYVTVPKSLAAPGNGVLVDIKEHGDTHTYHWRAKHPTTYAISINIGPFEVLKGDYRSRYGNTIPMQMWYLRGHETQAKQLFSEFPRMLDFFEQEIGPYPFGDEKMGVVETPHLGMEHQTINAYGNGYPRSEYGFDWLLQHEFSHEWFGNQVTNADWDDMWLHESFGTYMQPLYGQYLYGDMPYFSMLQNERSMVKNAFPIVAGRSQFEHEVYDAEHGPANDIYYKGSLMLHTLRQMIGDRAFFETVRRLVYGRPDPKPGNFAPHYATTRDYIDIVNQVSGRDLHWFFDVYLYEAALPKLVTRQEGNTLHLHWQVPHDKPFPMPVEVQVGDKLVTVPMTGGDASIPAPTGTLVVIDPHSKVLRDMPHFAEYQQWKKEQAEKKAKAAK